VRGNIDIDYLSDQLKALMAIPSPTGYTDTIVRHVCGELERLGVGYDVTRRGAIRGHLRGASAAGARAIVSHLDTLGAQVKALKPNGRLALVPIGHWSARFAEGARTTIFREGRLSRHDPAGEGVRPHLWRARSTRCRSAGTIVELRVDAYARTEDDLDKLGIEIGDIVAIDPQPEFLENGFIVSRHLDNKAGVAVMLAAMKALASGHDLPVDMFWLFTISEEVGHGAASILLPDVASMVAVDNGTSAPGQNSSEFGVTISMADMTGPFDFHLTRKLVELCKSQTTSATRRTSSASTAPTAPPRSRPARTCGPRSRPSGSTRATATSASTCTPCARSRSS
jgi:putative aminopeptidase FrvX